MSERLALDDGATVALPARGALPSQVHVFDAPSIRAVNAALAARRPLLIRGEPGTGKSQLAFAVAEALGRPCVSKVVDARTEARDLLWSFDAVGRLGLAQVLGALEGISEDAVFERLDERRFVRPGVLWWGFDWAKAESFLHNRGTPPAAPAGWKAGGGVVVLVDEIDKADSDVPNGLLEALGQGEFTPVGCDAPICMNRGAPPLLVVTTNEERALPDAFLRRCLVLSLALPEDDGALIDWLTGRGAAHHPKCHADVLRKAAELCAEDRRAVRDRGLVPPGQAEYLDLLRAVTALERSRKGQLEALDELARFTYQKHPQEQAR